MKAQYFVRKPIKIYKDWDSLTPFGDSNDTLVRGNKVVLLKEMKYEDFTFNSGSIGIYYGSTIARGILVQFGHFITPLRRTWVAKYKNKTKTKV